MNKVDGRIFLTADELERIARCPRSIGHLDRIEAAVECPHCRALADLGKELLKRAFRNAARPHTLTLLEELERAYVRRDDVYDPSPRDAAMVNDLATWCFGVGERVSVIRLQSGGDGLNLSPRQFELVVVVRFLDLFELHKRALCVRP